MRTRNTHCLRGHLFTTDPVSGRNRCRPCNIAYLKNHREKVGLWPSEKSEHRWSKRMFGGLREEVIQRDKEMCVDCGMTRKEHKEKWDRDITVDHIDGNGIRRPVRLKNNSFDNLQTLCLRCHGRKDGQRSKRTMV